jgi:ABC-2 type transport system ATP-binding protein
VLFSSHQLELVERLCDDLVIIADGAIAASGDREALREQHASPRFELVADADAGWVRDRPGISVVELDGARVVFDVANNSDAQGVLRDAVARGPVQSFGRVVPSLAEVFSRLVREPDHAKQASAPAPTQQVREVV